MFFSKCSLNWAICLIIYSRYFVTLSVSFYMFWYSEVAALMATLIDPGNYFHLKKQKILFWQNSYDIILILDEFLIYHLYRSFIGRFSSHVWSTPSRTLDNYLWGQEAVASSSMERNGSKSYCNAGDGRNRSYYSRCPCTLHSGRKII